MFRWSCVKLMCQLIHGNKSHGVVERLLIKFWIGL